MLAATPALAGGCGHLANTAPASSKYCDEACEYWTEKVSWVDKVEEYKTFTDVKNPRVTTEFRGDKRDGEYQVEGTFRVYKHGSDLQCTLTVEDKAKKAKLTFLDKGCDGTADLVGYSPVGETGWRYSIPTTVPLSTAEYQRFFEKSGASRIFYK